MMLTLLFCSDYPLSICNIDRDLDISAHSCFLHNISYTEIFRHRIINLTLYQLFSRINQINRQTSPTSNASFINLSVALFLSDRILLWKECGFIHNKNTSSLCLVLSYRSDATNAGV